MTALQKMIDIVEQGYNSNAILWEDWKRVLLETEKLQMIDIALQAKIQPPFSVTDAEDYIKNKYNKL